MKQALHEIEVLFTNVFPLIDRTELGDKEVKVWMLSGDLVDMADRDLLIESIYPLKSKLPNDTKILRFDFLNGHILNPICGVDINAFRDRYGLLFCSSEWDKIKEGEKIPEIQVIFSRKDKDSSLTCEIRDVEQEILSLQQKEDRLRRVLDEVNRDAKELGSFNLALEAHIQKLHIERGDSIIVKDQELALALSEQEITDPRIDFNIPIIVAPEGIEKVSKDQALSILNELTADNQLSDMNCKTRLNSLLDAILSPTSTSSSVIKMAEEIREELKKDSK